MSHGFGPVYSPKDYAGFIRRTLAILLDGIICYAAYVLFFVSYYAVKPSGISQHHVRVIATVWYVLSLVYMVAMRFTEKGTLGYRIVGIKYVYMLADKAPPARIAYRSVLAMFLLIFLAIDHIWILFDQRKQALHDKMSGFYVVRKRAEPIGSAPVVQRLLNLMSYTFVVWEPLVDQVTAPPTQRASG